MWHSGVCFKRRYVMVYGIFAFFGICRPFSVDLPAKTERVWLFKVPIKERNVPLLISVIIIIALTGLDQLTKHLATVYLAPVGAMPFIPGVMELRYVLNDGAAFSMLADAEWGRVFLIVVTGLALAALAAALRWVEVLLRPLMLTIKSIPVASFIILALMWLRSAGNLAVFISFLMVLPVVYTNTLAGIRETDTRLLEMAAVFRVPPAKRVRYLYVPAALPYFRSACTVGLGLCWKSGVAAEVIGITSGSIGEALYNAKILFSTAELLAWTVVIVLLSLAFERLFLWGLARVESVLLERSGT